MSYIGNPVTSTNFPKDTFSGNGSTTAFTMSVAPASVNAIIVIVSGVTQDTSTYSIVGTTLTFSTAPPTGTDNIAVRHLGVAGIPNTPSAASVGISALSATGTPSASTFLRGDNTWAAAAAGGLGSGQTWQNMTASRAGSTTYTNSTGKPISIVATCGLNGSTISLTIGGLVIQSMGNTGAGNGNVTGIVPNNTTYSVTLPSALSSWYELR